MSIKPFARNYCKYRKFRHNLSGTTWSPVALAKAYSYPLGLTGAGRTIGIIELGGGFAQTDYDTYMKSLGLPTKAIEVVSVDGGKNIPDGPNGAEGEVCLDIDVCGGMAPGATLAVYFCPNTEEGFVDGVAQASKDGCDAISISWGSDEKSWQSLTPMNNALQAYAATGGCCNVAAGDNGSSDGDTGNNLDFPGSSPYALMCGGTTLAQNGSNFTETVWNDGTNGGATGGGISAFFPEPAYQNAALIKSNWRNGPDVAGVADPETGIPVVIGGRMYILGGTSAVAPQWAALSVLLMEGMGKRIGPLHPFIYGLPKGVGRDITVGNNGTFIAKSGYDCCTGLGTPNGAMLLAALKAAANPIPPVPPPPPVNPPSATTITLSAALPAGKYTLSPVASTKTKVVKDWHITLEVSEKNMQIDPKQIAADFVLEYAAKTGRSFDSALIGGQLGTILQGIIGQIPWTKVFQAMEIAIPLLIAGQPISAVLAAIAAQLGLPTVPTLAGGSGS